MEIVKGVDFSKNYDLCNGKPIYRLKNWSPTMFALNIWSILCQE